MCWVNYGVTGVATIDVPLSCLIGRMHSKDAVVFWKLMAMST